MWPSSMPGARSPRACMCNGLRGQMLKVGVACYEVAHAAEDDLLLLGVEMVVDLLLNPAFLILVLHDVADRRLRPACRYVSNAHRHACHREVLSTSLGVLVSRRGTVQWAGTMYSGPGPVVGPRGQTECSFGRKWLLYITTPFNGLFSRTTAVSGHQTGKTSLYLNDARDDWALGWLDHMQTICTSVQTDRPNHTDTSSLKFCRPDALHGTQPTVPKNSKQFYRKKMQRKSSSMIICQSLWMRR